MIDFYKILDTIDSEFFNEKRYPEFDVINYINMGFAWAAYYVIKEDNFIISDLNDIKEKIKKSYTDFLKKYIDTRSHRENIEETIIKSDDLNILINYFTEKKISLRIRDNFYPNCVRIIPFTFIENKEKCFELIDFEKVLFNTAKPLYWINYRYAKTIRRFLHNNTEKYDDLDFCYINDYFEKNEKIHIYENLYKFPLYLFYLELNNLNCKYTKYNPSISHKDLFVYKIEFLEYKALIYIFIDLLYIKEKKIIIYI